MYTASPKVASQVTTVDILSPAKINLFHGVQLIQEHPST